MSFSNIAFSICFNLVLQSYFRNYKVSKGTVVLLRVRGWEGFEPRVQVSSVYLTVFFGNFVQVEKEIIHSEGEERLLFFSKERGTSIISFAFLAFFLLSRRFCFC